MPDSLFWVAREHQFSGGEAVANDGDGLLQWAVQVVQEVAHRHQRLALKLLHVCHGAHHLLQH